MRAYAEVATKLAAAERRAEEAEQRAKLYLNQRISQGNDLIRQRDDVQEKLIEILELLNWSDDEDASVVDRVRYLTSQLSSAKEEVERLKSTLPFVAAMDQELTANVSKGDFEAWHPEPTLLASEIKHHVGKLMVALAQNDAAQIREYAADVANYARKAWELAAAPSPKGKEHP